MTISPLGRTRLEIPPIVFGTSCLGNLYQEIPYEVKLQILKEIFSSLDGKVILDTAGKYGAGLALEVIGKGLKDLDIPESRILLSNKLGWYRTPLETPEPTFESGVWMGLKNDAVQKISHDGILSCWEQGCNLLGDRIRPALVSVHDPDEYLAAARTPKDREKHLQDILDAYKALHTLKNSGETQAVGVGAKDWKVIQEIASYVELDWVMFANSLTIYSHPPELLNFMDHLHQQGTGIINSAVFNAGFLTGGQFFDYRVLDPENTKDKAVFRWRENFHRICFNFHIEPAEACVRFGLSHPAVSSVALNTSKPERIRQNVALTSAQIPDEFWIAMKKEGLISEEYPYVG